MTSLSLPSLWGGHRQRQDRGAQARTGSPLVKRFFFGKDFNSAWDYMLSTDLPITTRWGCIQNVQACEGIEGGIVYVCPCANEHPQFEAIVNAIRSKKVRMIFLTEVVTEDLQ